MNRPLNHRWLLGAVVSDRFGGRLGTVSKVNAHRITYLVRGVEHHDDAGSLDLQGRLTKPNAADPKYL